MDYVCGWDGGGTKTKICCQDQYGVTLGEATFGPLNLNGATRLAVVRTIEKALTFMSVRFGGLSSCRALVIGMAGISNAEAVRLVRETIADWGFGGQLILVSDSEIAFAGALRDHPGGVLIAGTGSICLVKNVRGQIYRSGGRGHLIDDGGSGYALGRDILSAVVKADDGRAPHTCLTDAVYRYLQINDIKHMIGWLYDSSTGKREIAALAPLLTDALNANDAAAISIASRAASDLSSMAVAAWRKSGLSGGEFALLGSILEHFPYIRNLTAEQCRTKCTNLNIIRPRMSPAEGAAWLALKQFQNLNPFESTAWHD